MDLDGCISEFVHQFEVEYEEAKARFDTLCERASQIYKALQSRFFLGPDAESCWTYFQNSEFFLKFQTLKASLNSNINSTNHHQIIINFSS